METMDPLVLVKSPPAPAPKHALRAALLGLGMGAGLLASPAAFAQEPGADGNCIAPSAWFPQSQTPRPNDAKFESTSNCVFHQWSWQMFLWLTQEWNGHPRFLDFTDPKTLIGIKSTGMLPRLGLSDAPTTFYEFLQAGPDGILVDQQGRSVYYSQYLNPTFVEFITTNKLTDPSVVQKMDPNTEFPIDDKTGNGALELKAAWKVVAPGENTGDMFTMTTQVASLVNQNGKIVIDPSQPQNVKVALVGFHLGGVVAGHPEMIWATFEHQDNAPNVPAGATMDTVISPTSDTFYKGGTQYADCNQNMGGAGRLKLDEDSQTLSPSTEVCRQFEFGNDPQSTDPDVQTNDANIQQLNDSVHAQLAADDVWRNYYEVGAIWFNTLNGLKPGLTLEKDDLLTGSLKLSNATIETFTQVQNTENNCFRCHNTEQSFPSDPNLAPLKPTNLNISHAFQNIYYWSQGTGTSQTVAHGKGDAK